MGTVGLTAAHALVRFLADQYSERDEVEHRHGGCPLQWWGTADMGADGRCSRQQDLVIVKSTHGNSSRALFLGSPAARRTRPGPYTEQHRGVPMHLTTWTAATRWCVGGGEVP